MRESAKAAHEAEAERHGIRGGQQRIGKFRRDQPGRVAGIFDNLIGTAARVVASQGWQGLLCNQRPLNWEIGHSHLCENDLPVPLTSEYAGGGV